MAVHGNQERQSRPRWTHGTWLIHARNVSIGCVAVGDPAIEEIFCLAARADLKNIKILIVPTDWRTKAFNATPTSGPSWLPESYTILKNEIDLLR